MTEPDRWQTALRRFLDMCGGRCVFLGIIDSSMDTLPVTSVVGPESSRLDDGMRLHRELIPLDPGLPYALARPEGGNFRFSDTSPELTDEPDTWRDFIRHDFGSGDYHSRFSAERDKVSLVLALHTMPDAPRLTTAQERLHAIVFDHFERAARLAYRPPDPKLARAPMLIIDRTGRIVDANAGAERILSRQDGLSVRYGRLRAARHDQDQQLQHLIRRACTREQTGRAETWLTVERPSATPWLLRLAPLPLMLLGMSEARQYCTIEIRNSSNGRQVDPEPLREIFGLTPREAQVASLLASSHSDLPSIAKTLAIGHETARTHMRSTLLKCGVANQLELVRLLAGLNQPAG